MKPIYLIVGTRAQLIKMAPVMLELEKEQIGYEFLYTQQHKVSIDDLIENFKIKTRYRTIVKRKDEAKTIKLFAGWAFQMIAILVNPFSRRKLLNQGRGLILTHGDTATAAWAAIYGQTSFCKVMHIESGLRSYNLFKPFPEELMRLITFAFSNYYICPNEWAVSNLKWFPGIKYNVGANQMYDSLMYALDIVNDKNYKTKLKSLDLPKKFALVSLHRYENIFKEKMLQKIIELLENISKKIDLVIVLHPATEKKLKDGSYYNRLSSNEKIKLVPRLDFLTFVEITQKSEFVITDGGSNQEEMSYVGKPTLLFREKTERKEGLDNNVVLSEFDLEIINYFVRNYKQYQKGQLKLDKSPSSQTKEIISKFTL